MHPDLTDEEVHDKVSHALMNEDDIDSSSMFAQEMIDDRYKREEAKIALLYAREQKKELEQVRVAYPSRFCRLHSNNFSF